MRTKLDWLTALAARRLLAWTARRVDPRRQTWLEAMQAELDGIKGGIEQLIWALGGLQLLEPEVGIFRNCFWSAQSQGSRLLMAVSRLVNELASRLGQSQTCCKS